MGVDVWGLLCCCCWLCDCEVAAAAVAELEPRDFSLLAARIMARSSSMPLCLALCLLR